MSSPAVKMRNRCLHGSGGRPEGGVRGSKDVLHGLGGRPLAFFLRGAAKAWGSPIFPTPGAGGLQLYSAGVAWRLIMPSISSAAPTSPSDCLEGSLCALEMHLRSTEELFRESVRRKNQQLDLLQSELRRLKTSVGARDEAASLQIDAALNAQSGELRRVNVRNLTHRVI